MAANQVKHAMSESTPLAQPAASSRADQLRASPPLFASPWMDRLTRVHPIVPVAIFLPAIVALAVIAAGHVGALALAGLFVAGYLLWTLTEYWLHRLVFHFEPPDGIGARLHHLIHGVHHDHPSDPRRLLMPPSASVPLAGLFLLVFWLVFGDALWAGVGSGFLAGYLVYDMTHYWLHHRAPQSRIGRKLREAHMRHHFQDDTKGFGVSAPYWDLVFGTAPPKRATRPRD